MGKGEQGVKSYFKGKNMLNSPEPLKQLWSSWTQKWDRIFFAMCLPLPGCVALPQMGSGKMVLMRLLQIGHNCFVALSCDAPESKQKL